MSRIYNRRAIFLAAWQLRRDGITMSEAMRIQWAIARVRTALTRGVVEFVYTKLDGSQRIARGTRNLRYVPSEPRPQEERPQEERPCPEGLIRYYDIDKRGWRSFYESRIEQFVSLNV